VFWLNNQIFSIKGINRGWQDGAGSLVAMNYLTQKINQKLNKFRLSSLNNKSEEDCRTLKIYA
jgi:hypothetical protein